MTWDEMVRASTTRLAHNVLADRDADPEIVDAAIAYLAAPRMSATEIAEGVCEFFTAAELTAIRDAWRSASARHEAAQRALPAHEIDDEG